MSVPEPGPGEVRLRTLAAGINFRDVLVGLGMYPGAASLGGECVGVVESVGPGVTAPAPGEVVYGFVPGSLATDVVVRADLVAAVPDTIGIDRRRRCRWPT